MSQFYDQASLVVVPSGYKAGTVYAQKPLTTDGQLAFTRTGDTATRVNSAGLIEKVRTNLILQSNSFDTTWTNVNTSETGGEAGYDGTNNAWLLVRTGGLARIAQSITINSVSTFSVYLKAGTQNWSWLRDLAGNGAYFDLANGLIGSQTGLISANIVSVGNGWYRCSISAAFNTTEFRIYVADANNNASGTSGNIYIQDAQLETGDVATDYIPTTSAAVSTGPVANVPRLDYLGSTCPRLLLEPQRTNLALYSEQFNNAAWVKSAGGTGTAPAVTANNATSPDGYQNADTIVFNAGAGTSASDQSIMYQALGSLSAGTYTGSFYAKTASGTAQIMMRHAGASNFTKFTITDQWQRFTSTEVKGSTSTAFLEILIRRGLNEPINASATIQLWGVQLELGAYATSYIPTLAASATRGADACSKTGISSLIGQTEGTLFVEVNDAVNTGTIDRVVAIGDGTGNNRIIVLKNASGNIFFFVASGGSTIINQTNIAGTSLVNGNFKIAVAYKSGEYAIYRNGASVFTSTAATVPATSNYYLAVNEEGGVSAFSGKFSQALLFPTRLSNAALAELTTL